MTEIIFPSFRLVSTTNLEVVVLDVNDNPPEFSSKAYFASVEEGAGADGGSSDVVRVLATSRDSGVNAEISYRIQKGAYDDFAIDPSTGEVTLSGKLNYDTRSYYELEIVAMDGGEPSLSGEYSSAQSSQSLISFLVIQTEITTV